MRQIVAILGDSFRESVDRRSLTVLLILATLPILFCFSLSFEGQSLSEALSSQTRELARIQLHRGGIHLSERNELEFEVLEVGPVDDRFDWDSSVRGGLVAPLKFANVKELDDVAVRWFRAQQGWKARQDESIEIPRRIDGIPRRDAFLERRFRSFGYDHVSVRDDHEDPNLLHVAVRADQPATIQGAHSASVLFGVWTIPLRGVSIATFVIVLQWMLATIFVGFIGMLIALSACSAFVPNMLQKGSLDLLLARPISRTKLLVSKYLGGLWFVFLIASFLVGGCWLGLAAGSGYTGTAFLVSIFTLTFSFAALYAVAVLIGVQTRSAGVSALIAIGVWGVSNGITGAHQLVKQNPFGSPVDIPGWVSTLLDTAYTVLPKIKDIDSFNASVIASSVPPDIASRMFETELSDVDPLWTFGTTTLFTIGVLGLAIWRFRSRDY